MNKFDDVRYWEHYMESRGSARPRPDGYYLYFRYTSALPDSIQAVRISYFRSLREAVCLIKHIYVRDAILGDMKKDLDPFNRGADLNAELEHCAEAGVTRAAEDKELWNEIEGITGSRIGYRDVQAFLEKFNSAYASTDGDEYEIVLCKGISEFRAFRIDRCGDIWDDEEREEFDYYTDPDSPGFAEAAGYLDSCAFY